MTAQADEQKGKPTEVVVARIRKSDRCEIRAILREYKGEKLAELRVFVPKKDGSWTPTARGVPIARERVGELAGLAVALYKAARKG